MKKRTIELGKALVEELSLEPGTDTLSRWMAHYVAEQMVITKEASGAEKEAAERHCFETILRLWEKRASFPRGKRPFENFDAVFSALENLAPDSQRSVFARAFVEKDSDDELHPEVKQWLRAADSVDTAAKTLIRFCLGQAHDLTTNDEVKEWLRNSVGIGSSDDIEVIRQLASFSNEFAASDEEEGNDEARREELASALHILKWFQDCIQEMLDALDTSASRAADSV